MENIKTKLKPPCPPSSLLPRLSFPPDSFTFSAPSRSGVWGMQVGDCSQLSHNFSCAAPSCSCCSPAPARGTSYRIQSFRISPVLILPTESCPLGTNCSWVGPPHILPVMPSPGWILSHRPQFLLGICSTVGFPRATAALRAYSLLSCEVLPRLQGDNMQPHSLLQGLQGNLCSSAWGPSSPASSLTLVSAGLCFSYVLTCLSQQLCSTF